MNNEIILFMVILITTLISYFILPIYLISFIRKEIRDNYNFLDKKLYRFLLIIIFFEGLMIVTGILKIIFMFI